MDISDLRIALFSGNYNMVRDGANQALNRLVAFLLAEGAAVRVYSPTIADPAFAPTGDLVSVPSVPIPGRSEYRFAVSFHGRVQRDMAAFAPNVLHTTAPDYVQHRALNWAMRRKIPVLSSVHTRFDTYPRYYHMGFTEPLLTGIMRRFYLRCDTIVAPSESMAQVLQDEGMGKEVGIWSRGVDREVFNPARRDLEWRRALGIADGELAVGFLGRLVVEKGLDVFSDTIDALARRGVPHRVLVIGEGPARGWFEGRLPGAVFAGLQAGHGLGQAVAGMDVLFNPSVTETFGNVTLEAMACGLPVVAARATGSESLVVDGVTGRLVGPRDVPAYADAIAAYVADPALRAAHGAAGEARSREFAWDRINRSLAETYLRLVREKAGAA